MAILFDPTKLKDSIYDIIYNDDTIISLLDLTNKTDVEKAEHILKRNKWDELANDTKRLNIYHRPSSDTRNDILQRGIIQIDCHVPAKQDYIAENIIKRVKVLLHNKCIENHILKFAGQLGELPTMPGFYCFGCRFLFYYTI